MDTFSVPIGTDGNNRSINGLIKEGITCSDLKGYKHVSTDPASVQ